MAFVFFFPIDSHVHECTFPIPTCSRAFGAEQKPAGVIRYSDQRRAKVLKAISQCRRNGQGIVRVAGRKDELEQIALAILGKPDRAHLRNARWLVYVGIFDARQFELGEERQIAIDVNIDAARQGIAVLFVDKVEGFVPVVPAIAVAPDKCRRAAAVGTGKDIEHAAPRHALIEVIARIGPVGCFDRVTGKELRQIAFGDIVRINKPGGTAPGVGECKKASITCGVILGGISERQSTIDMAVAKFTLMVSAVIHPSFRATVILAQDNVDYAGDGVRSVNRGGAALQHFNTFDGRQRDGIQIKELRLTNIGIGVGRRGNAPPIHQHQRRLRTQTSQRYRGCAR